MALIESATADTEQTGDEKLLSEAKEFFKLSAEASRDERTLFLEDLQFRAGEQWPQAIKNERNADGRPCLVINRIPGFLQQITNDQRQNRPSIKVHPVDDKADVETAKVRQGLIRHIEYNSNADTAYDTAFDSAATGGFGYFRIVTEYCDPMSFDQEILIKRIRNPLSVFFDPHSQEPDGSDANRAGIDDFMPADEFKAQYPNAKLTSLIDSKSVGNEAPDWMKEDNSVRVAEYFYKEFKEVEIVLLSTGETVEKAMFEQRLGEIAAQAQASGQPLPEIQVVRERKARVPVVKWVKLNGFEVLEKTDWLGTWIPIIPVYGAELYIDGKRILEGIVRHAKDPQRMYNYWKSAETEAIALAPRAPFIAAEGQLEGYEAQWETANRRNHSVLLYKPTSVGGQPVAPPQRNSFEPAVGAITQAAMFAADDMKAATGIYDASLGAKSNETSGIAIQRRNNQSQTSNFHFVDNLTRSLRHAGRIIDEIIPKVYDTARTARIIGDDGTQELVQINQPFQKDGKEQIHDMSVGKYDVTVDVGPSYASKRQEAAASMIEMTKAIPAISQAAPDLIARNMDWPGAQELADRLKKTLPPGLADDKDKSKEIPPQVQAQMQQMSHMVEQLTTQLHAANDALDTKKVEIESRERIEMAKLETTATIELAKLESKEALNMLSHQIAELDARTQMLGFNQPIAFEEESQEQPQAQDGGQPAAPQPGQNPTGGESPGSPMEGIFQ